MSGQAVMFSRRVALVVLVLVLLSKIAGLVLVLLAACSSAPQPVAVETPAAAVPVGTDPQPEILAASVALWSRAAGGCRA